MAGLAWAGAGLVPVQLDPPASPAVPGLARLAPAGAERVRPRPGGAGGLSAGAAKVSLRPRPAAYDGEWETDRGACATFDDPSRGLDHVPDFRVRWPENPNCLYMGGYGIGPMNPITEWTDPYGLWVRALALSDGEDTLVLVLVDGTYYFGDYASMCEACGFFDLQRSLGEELGIDPSGLMFASTHSHTAPDFIGGWGGVPAWYMAQTEDALRRAVRRAVSSMRPAVLELGELGARAFNAERRDFYRSAEEQNLAWFRLLEPGGGRAIATVGAYAAHPVTADPATGIADADFPAVFAAAVEQRFGGVGLFFQTGLGNLSPRGDKVEIGTGLARALPGMASGTIVRNPDIRSAQAFWNQPVTNSGLLALGVPGFFDRPFSNLPAAVSAGKGGNKPCTSASPVSVETAVSAAKVGPLWITGAPGEVFANLTNTIKEANPDGVTLPLALVNDGLGYIMQSFETDHAGRQVTGFVGQVAEYEDAYSIDACFGDVVLEETLRLLGTL